MAARRWGEIVRRGLAGALPVVAVGCARAEPRDAAATPAATRFFPDARGELSELVPILSPAAAPHAHPVHVRRAVVRVGAGGFLHEEIVVPRRTRSFRANGAPEPDAAPRCPLEGPGECALFAFTRDGVLWSTPRRVPAGWGSFSPGATVAYALHTSSDGVAIDTIDADGQVASWLRQPGKFRVDVHEAPHGPVVVGDDGAWFVADVVGSDGVRRVGAHVPLSVASVEFSLAKAARAIVSEGRRAAWGRAQAVSLLDASGRATGPWGLVWTRVIPPAFGTPRRAPLLPDERRGPVNECASRSRPLSDPTVGKRLMLTVLDHTKVVREVVLDHPTASALTGASHAVDAVPNGVVVDRVAYELSGARRNGAPPNPPPLGGPQLVGGMVDDESVTGMAFDVGSGDGLVLVARGEGASFGRRFDASGRFVGEPFALYDGIGAHAERERVVLARVDGVWIAYDAAEGRLAWLTGPLAGQVVPVANAGRPLGFVRSRAHVAELAFDAEGRVVAVGVDVRDGTVGVAREVAATAGLAVFARASDGAPLLLQAPTMRTVDLRDGAVTEPHPDAADGKNPVTYDAGTDVVLRTFAAGGATVLTWVGSGASLWLYEPGYGEPPKTGALLPPVLPSGWVFAPDRVVRAATPEQVAACGGSVLTSPRVAVLGCADSAVRTLAGRRAGLRVLRLPQ